MPLNLPALEGALQAMHNEEWGEDADREPIDFSLIGCGLISTELDRRHGDIIEHIEDDLFIGVDNQAVRIYPIESSDSADVLICVMPHGTLDYQLAAPYMVEVRRLGDPNDIRDVLAGVAEEIDRLLKFVPPNQGDTP